jgi:replicative DNA helicase
MDMVEYNIETLGSDTITTGLHELDDMMGGYQKRKTIIIGGISHHGKTALLLESALKAAEDGRNVAFFNVADGDDIDVMNRLATMVSGVSSKKLIKGTVTPAEQRLYTDAMGYVSTLPIYIKSQKGMSPGAIEIECRTLKDRSGRPIAPDIIINDYIQRMYLAAETKQNHRISGRREELMLISQGLTKLGDEKHFNCPVVTGAQLLMSGRHKERPTGADVQESKDIYQDCDVFTIVYRESVEKPETDNPHLVELIVCKNKQIGEIGTVNAYWDKTAARIRNAETHRIELGNTR